MKKRIQVRAKVKQGDRRYVCPSCGYLEVLGPPNGVHPQCIFLAKHAKGDEALGSIVAMRDEGPALEGTSDD